MKNKLLIFIFMIFVLTSCVGVSSKGLFGTGVSVALDPRTVGTQIDDSIMQKNLLAKLVFMNKKYALTINSKVLDGRIFLTGKVENPEEKLRITKIAWEIKGVRSVKNDINLKENFNFSDKPSWDLMELGISTNAKLFIAPIQDILSLDDSCRLNKPGTVKDNWKWKLNISLAEINSFLEQYSELGKRYSRN